MTRSRPRPYPGIRPRRPRRPRPTVAKENSGEQTGGMRLQKILAAAGLGSRRQCEELIETGRVEVDRKLVTELGAKADPETQEVRVDGVKLPKTRLVYFMVNKPPGIISTSNDPSGRPRVIDLVGYDGRVFTVGRLDKSSEGLILCTNDGDLADRLTHPRYGVDKTYKVEVAGTLERKELEPLLKGIHLSEGMARAVAAKIIRHYKNSTLLEIVLSEGRNREVRRILARIGHKVERLQRIAIGPLRLGELPLGHSRALEREELKVLKHAARGNAGAKLKPKLRRGPKKPKLAAKPQPQVRTVIGGDSAGAAARKGGPAKPRAGARPATGRPASGRPAGSGRPAADRPATGRPATGRPIGKGGPHKPGRPAGNSGGPKKHGPAGKGGPPKKHRPAGKPGRPQRG